jgi:hypothetical protein
MSRKMIRRLLPLCAWGAAVTTLGWAAWAFSVPENDWTIAGPFGGSARSLAIDPQKPDVLLAGGMNSLVFRSQDAGQNWKLLDFPKHNLSEVTSLLVDPADSNHYLAGVIAAEDGGLLESHDAGATWKAVKSMNKFGVRALRSMPEPHTCPGKPPIAVKLGNPFTREWSTIPTSSPYS